MSYVATDYSALVWANGTRTLHSGGAFPTTRIGAYTSAGWAYATRICIAFAPSALVATAASATQINLVWTDNSGAGSNETAVSIDYEQVDSGTIFTSPTTTTAAADATSKSITGLTAGKRYIFRVKATNAAGSSSYSSSANATTDTVPVMTLASPTATVAVGATVTPATGCTVVDADGDNLAGLIEYDPTYLTFSSIPSGWSQDSPGVYSKSSMSAAQAQADFRAAVFTGVTATTGKAVIFSIDDGRGGTDSDTVTVTVTAVPHGRPGNPGINNALRIGL